MPIMAELSVHAGKLITCMLQFSENDLGSDVVSNFGLPNEIIG